MGLSSPHPSTPRPLLVQLRPSPAFAMKYVRIKSLTPELALILAQFPHEIAEWVLVPSRALP